MPPRSKRHLVPAMLAVAFAASLVYVVAGAAPPDGTDLTSESCDPGDGSTTTTTTADDEPTTTTTDDADGDRRGDRDGQRDSRRNGRMTSAAAGEDTTTTTAGTGSGATTTTVAEPTTTTTGAEPTTTTTGGTGPTTTTTVAEPTTTTSGPTTTTSGPSTTTTVPVGVSTTTTTGGAGSTTTTTVPDPEPCPSTTTTTTAPDGTTTTTTSRPATTTTTSAPASTTTTTTQPSSGGGPLLGGNPGPAGGPSRGNDDPPPAGPDGTYDGAPVPVFERQEPVPEQDLSAWVPPVFEEMAQPQSPAIVTAQAVDEAPPRPRGRQRVRGDRVPAPAEEFAPTVPPLSYPQFVPDRSVVGSLPGRIDYPLPAGSTAEAALGGLLPGPGEGMPDRSGPVMASTILVLLGWAAHSAIAWRRRPRYQPA